MFESWVVGRFVEYLELYGPLSDADRAAAEALPVARRRFEAGEDIIVEGDAPLQCRLLISGLAFRHKTLRDGRRQIMSFYVPGEVCDIEGLLLAMDHGVSALGRAEVGFIPHAAMEALLDAHPAIARALWRSEMVENAVAREWMVGMGRRTAYARIAHLFCEMYARLSAVGLVENNRCRFPITQTHLSDSLGLSVVHTNRVLQALRGDGLLSFRGGELIVHDWPGLQAAGEFDPTYLHMRSAAT
ncbi:Crp/Fnr family transcriptional regulator [Phenylobacterium sp.]|uniref:Crp/Fnr family transcriptional regulator n=1 Tax=Phenylobacterium sp. TaxID=1871053 RepID=UPI002DE453DB|nr:Crp/Fnr family transcriptional regulator [Phenylobacterium sp.]